MTRTMRLARRAGLAILLMVGFYVLVVAVAAILFLLPYGEWKLVHRVEGRLAVLCYIGGASLLLAAIPRPDRFEPPGPRLDETSQRRLFAEIRSVATATGQPMPTDVFLVNDVNAFVAYRGGVMGFGSHRVMGIGLPLMQGLTRSEFKSVLAHEFGHYAAGDVRLGPWIYKTRAAIQRAVESLDESVVAVVFTLYAGFFMRLTLAISREQEFLADALAARTVHPAVAASALRRSAGVAHAFPRYWTVHVAPALESGYLPPIATGFKTFLESTHTSEAIRAVANWEEAKGQSSPLDTHPPLNQRLEALRGIAPPNVPLSSEPPAASLLDDIDGVAGQLLAFNMGEDTVARLRRIGWTDLMGRAYPEMWRERAWRFNDFLSPHTVDAPPMDRTAYAALGSKMPGGGTRGSHERVAIVCEIVAAGVATALLAAGATLESEPGSAMVFRRHGMTMDPFSEVPRLVAGDLKLTDWQARCHAMGIAGRPLGPSQPAAN